MNDDVSYFEADDYEDKYMEVVLTDAEDNEYIYWVSLDLISEDEDNEDIAIKIAKPVADNIVNPKLCFSFYWIAYLLSNSSKN